MKHALDTNIASQFGVNIALLLESFQYWTFKNLTRQHHIHDGLCWSYDTLDSLCEVFPYWTRRQIERIINNAVDAGLLVKGNYNQTKYDRTLWYALTPKTYSYYPGLLNEKHLQALWLSISPNGEMDFTEWGNGFHQTVTPIPPTDPITNKDIKHISASNEFENLGYTKERNEKSDYPSNQDEHKENDPQVVDTERNPAKSDYFENQTNKEANKSKSYQIGINDILQFNPFQIPQQIIQDWMANRKQKRIAITKTAWDKINKELAKCDDPISAFEEMVLAGWQSFKAEWVNKNIKSSNKAIFDHESTKWAEGIEQDMF